MNSTDRALAFKILFVVALLFGAACQTQNAPATANQNSNSVVGGNANTAANVAASPIIATTLQRSAPQTISFDSADNVKIVGTFYPVAAPNSPAVLMLHQFGSNRASYQNLATQFQQQGIAVLAIDGRGFGESNKKADGSRISPSQSNEAVAGMKADTSGAIKFLSEQQNVDAKRIGIVGASYGSSLAIIYAADNANIKAVALLSPGTNYFGNLPTTPAAQKYGARPLLIVAAEDDAESAAASRALEKLAAGDQHKLQIYQKGGHGTGLFAAGVGLEELLLSFFQRQL